MEEIVYRFKGTKQIYYNYADIQYALNNYKHRKNEEIETLALAPIDLNDIIA